MKPSCELRSDENMKGKTVFQSFSRNRDLKKPKWPMDFSAISDGVTRTRVISHSLNSVRTRSVASLVAKGSSENRIASVTALISRKRARASSIRSESIAPVSVRTFHQKSGWRRLAHSSAGPAGISSLTRRARPGKNPTIFVRSGMTTCHSRYICNRLFLE